MRGGSRIIVVSRLAGVGWEGTLFLKLVIKLHLKGNVSDIWKNFVDKWV